MIDELEVGLNGLERLLRLDIEKDLLFLNMLYSTKHYTSDVTIYAVKKYITCVDDYYKQWKKVHYK